MSRPPAARRAGAVASRFRGALARWLLALLAAAAAAPARAAGLDLGLFAALLREHTREVPDVAGVRVDYAALRRDERWPQLVRTLGAAEPEALRERDAQLAFWINAYNIAAIDLVVQRSPRRSIRDLGSLLSPVWDRPAARIGGRELSLGEIEHGILRPLREPRIHFAIVCASVSCPPLSREPWQRDGLASQLDAAARGFLANPDKGLRVDAEADTLRLSRIFDWFESDFDAAGGVLEFALRYAPASAAAWIRAHRDTLELDSLDYDWELNDLARAPASAR